MNESRATRYQRLKRRARATGLVSAELMLGAIAFTPAARALARLSQEFAHGLSGPSHAAISLAGFVALVVALWELAALPAACVAVRVDGAYGQAAPTAEEVLGAQAQATVVVFPAALAAGAVIVASVRMAGAWWWVAAGLLLALGLAGAVGIGPALFARLAEVRALGRPDLVRRLAELARRAEVPVAGIDEWVVGEADRTTALVAGVGRSRRVLLSSEVAREWADDEVVVVVAHELAHHRHHDLWRTLAVDAGLLSASLFLADRVLAAVGPALGLAGPGDLAALPLVALVASAVWILATPLRHAQSRRQERRADLFALALTGGADAFGTAVRRLGARRLAEERPSAMTRWLYYSHPSVAERLALADTYRQTAGRLGTRGR